MIILRFFYEQYLFLPLLRWRLEFDCDILHWWTIRWTFRFDTLAYLSIYYIDMLCHLPSLQTLMSSFPVTQAFLVTDDIQKNANAIYRTSWRNEPRTRLHNSLQNYIIIDVIFVGAETKHYRYLLLKGWFTKLISYYYIFDIHMC